MKKYLLSVCIFIFACCNAFATHIRAGEITYKWLSGYTYEITITTYSNTGSGVDDCSLMTYFGDNDSAVAPRINGPIGSGSSPCAGSHEGEVLTTVANTRENIYRTIHTYDGPGNYTITVSIQNRNDGICNINNLPGFPGSGHSDNVSFFLHSELVINPFLSPNTSSILTRLPIDQACLAQCFEHNPGAVDINGDSLYYKLIDCYEGDGTPIDFYGFPPNMNDNSIDHRTGDLLWCSPNQICQYNIAILIEEWKYVPAFQRRYYAGSVVRDMQINVAACANTAPDITTIRDTCIVAGTNLTFDVTATDDNSNIISLDATGGPFLLSPAASFPAVSGPGSVTGTFNWTPACSAIRLLPYSVTFKTIDTDPLTPLVNFESMFITVVAPPPTGLTATPAGSGMILNWVASACADTTGGNPLKKYYIYRKNSCDPWTPGPCETGVPAYTGYTYIGATLNGAITTFTDNNSGIGLLHGVNYSYIVVAVYNDGSQSYASGNVCQQLVRDVPIITNVSVTATDGSTGQIWTHWVKPLGTAGNLDTVANPGPYEYRLMKGNGVNPASSSYVTEASYTFPAFWQLNDTGFVSSNLNTLGSAFTYRVDFYSNGIFKGSTHTASSVFLSSTPGDNNVQLSWSESVPWVNYKYFIYKEIPAGSGTFVLYDSTLTQNYIDSNLVNGRTYCYKVQSKGDYSDPALPRPLYNTSEIRCDAPVDLIPPCQPALTVTPDCQLPENTLSWRNPNNYCSNDAIRYNIYFAPTINEPLQLIHSISNTNDTMYTHVYNYEGVPSIAGCYAVTAVDSFANESPIINRICVDNCPYYELPNVFTPNGDNVNDLFIPLPYRFVKDVDIKIYDRWGLLMFQTNDPHVLWDGKSQDSKQQCSDGTYFYLCTVNEIRMEGIVPRVLKGFVQLISSESQPSR